MNSAKTRWFFGFLCITLGVSDVAATPLLRESNVYSVNIKLQVDEENPWSKHLTLDITALSSQTVRTLQFASRTAALRDAFLLDDDEARLIVHGTLGSGGDILTVIDIEKGTILDVIWGWRAAISPDKSKVVYNFRYPPHSLPLYETSVLLMYDFTQNPEENSMDTSQNKPIYRGFILWPDENRTQKNYFIPAQRYEEQQHIISPIVWNEKSSQVCFILQRGDIEDRTTPSYLVVVDVSSGALEPQVHIQEIVNGYGKESVSQRLNANKPIDRKIFARELSFVENDQAVMITINKNDQGNVLRIPLQK